MGAAEGSADLLRQARQGSSEALGTLLQACAPRLLALIRLRLGPSLRNRLESRDILQATVVKAIQRLETFEGEGRGSLVGWLGRIAENEIRDQADYHGRQRRDSFRDVPLEDAPELAHLASQVRSQTSRIALDERALRLERALETLSPDHREVIVLRKIEELSFDEVARRLGRTPDACRMLLARAMAALTLGMGDGP